MKLKTYFLCLLLLVTINACGEGENNRSCESLPPQISGEGLHTVLKLSAPPHINSLKLGDPIFLDVNNYSNTAIEVAPDQGLKIFWWKDNSWNAVRNGMDYLSAIDRLSPRAYDNPGGTVYEIVLNIPEQDDSVRVCLILEGIKDPDGSRSKVTAYTEILLNP